MTSRFGGVERGSDLASTVIESIGPTPVSESWTVVIGAITTSSSLVVPLVPFLASTPTTS